MVPAGDPPEQLGAARRDQLGQIARRISRPSAYDRGFGVAEQKEVGGRWVGGRANGREVAAYQPYQRPATSHLPRIHVD
jgi:hypothetical protein